MPYVHVKTAKTLDEAAKDALQKEIGALIAVIPGKNIDNCMTHITGGLSLYMGGKALEDGAFVEVRVYGAAPTESKREFVTKLFALLEAHGIAQARTYVNFVESDDWASRGTYYKS